MNCGIQTKAKICSAAGPPDPDRSESSLERHATYIGQPVPKFSQEKFSMQTTKDRIALVTGANKGIGFEIAASLAKKGIASSSAHAIGIGAKLLWQTSGARVSPLAMCKSI